MADKGWKIALGLLLVVAVGFYVQWFFTHFEAREHEVRREVSKEARRNPLLAAERFLRRIGREARSVSGRDRLLQPPPAGDLLLVNRFAAHLPPERQDALEQWLHQGGHLIVAAHGEWDEESGAGDGSFLDRFGVRLQLGGGCGCEAEESEEESEALSGEEASAAVPDEDEQEQEATLEVAVAGRSQPLRVAFDRERRLLMAPGAEWVVAHGEHAHLQQFRVGAGRLTVLSDNAFFHNDEIGEADHALLLSDLTAGAGKIWLLYSSDMPSLVALLWRNQPFLVVSGLITALLWLGYLTAYSGPRRRLSGRGRRSLLEHLDAAAAYAWRVGRSSGLLRGFREAALGSWERRHHQLGRLDRKERCRWIAEHSRLSVREVESALYEEVESEQDFVRVTAAQQRVLFGLNSSMHHRGTESTETSNRD